MPTYELLPEFQRDYARLNEVERRAFRLAVRKFIANLRTGAFWGSLRVKPLHANPNIFELTWAGQDGRATFDYGPSIIPGEPHIRWRRVGAHDILQNP